MDNTSWFVMLVSVHCIVAKLSIKERKIINTFFVAMFTADSCAKRYCIYIVINTIYEFNYRHRGCAQL